MPRLPMTIINECVVKGPTGEKQDQLLYLDIVRERQQRAFKLVQESHLITMSKIQRSNTKLIAILPRSPNFEVGNWIWIYNPQATVGQGVSEDNSHLVTKLAPNWTGPLQDSSSGTRSRTRWSTGRRQDPISGSSHGYAGKESKETGICGPL